MRAVSAETYPSDAHTPVVELVLCSTEEALAETRQQSASGHLRYSKMILRTVSGFLQVVHTVTHFSPVFRPTPRGNTAPETPHQEVRPGRSSGHAGFFTHCLDQSKF